MEDICGYLTDGPRFHLVFSESVALCCHFLFVEVFLSRVLLDCSSVRVGSYGVLGELGDWGGRGVSCFGSNPHMVVAVTVFAQFFIN
jgi:hypothetical protein